MRAFDFYETTVLELKSHGIRRMNVKHGLALMRHEPRQAPGAGHRMPLIAHASGIKDQRPLIIGRHGRRPVRRRYEARTAVRGCKSLAVSEQPLCAGPWLL